MDSSIQTALSTIIMLVFMMTSPVYHSNTICMPNTGFDSLKCTERLFNEGLRRFFEQICRLFTMAGNKNCTYKCARSTILCAELVTRSLLLNTVDRIDDSEPISQPFAGRFWCTIQRQKSWIESITKRTQNTTYGKKRLSRLTLPSINQL